MNHSSTVHNHLAPTLFWCEMLDLCITQLSGEMRRCWRSPGSQGRSGLVQPFESLRLSQSKDTPATRSGSLSHLRHIGAVDGVVTNWGSQ